MGCSSSTKVVACSPQQQIGFFDKYELADVLGRGAYGTVHLTNTVESNDVFAVKILDLHSGKKPLSQLRKDARDEERAWARRGQHPNVVGLRECLIEDRFAYFVMELCTGSLFAAWDSEPNLNEYTYARYFREMANALAHIHSTGVVHRDVKQDNFIVGAPDGRTVKLCDFGLSAVVVGDGKLSDRVGTPPYMAPEMLTDTGTYEASIDVWSFGVIVYTCFFGCWPYQPCSKTAKGMMKAVREGMVPPSFAPTGDTLLNVVSRTGREFVQALLNRDPLTRPSAASCLEMTYLNEGHGNKLQANKQNESMISLVPHFWAAVRCGVLKTRTPKVDAGQQLHLMQLQGNAQSRRGSCSSGRDGTMRPQTAPPDDIVGMVPMPSQPGLFDIQDHDLPISTDEIKHSTAVSKTNTSDTATDKRKASTADRPA